MIEKLGQTRIKVGQFVKVYNEAARFSKYEEFFDYHGVDRTELEVITLSKFDVGLVIFIGRRPTTIGLDGLAAIVKLADNKAGVIALHGLIDADASTCRNSYQTHLTAAAEAELEAELNAIGLKLKDSTEYEFDAAGGILEVGYINKDAWKAFIYRGGLKDRSFSDSIHIELPSGRIVIIGSYDLVAFSFLFLHKQQYDEAFTLGELDPDYKLDYDFCKQFA